MVEGEEVQENMEDLKPEKEGQLKESRPNLSAKDRVKAQRESNVHGRQKIKAWAEQGEQETRREGVGRKLLLHSPTLARPCHTYLFDFVTHILC